MSLSRKPKFHRIGNTWNSIVDFFSGQSRKRAKGNHSKNRRLTVDPLEQRMLLSVSPNPIGNIQVNQSGVDQWTYATDRMSFTGQTTSQSVATDNNGDFVVVWSRYDTSTDPDSGAPVFDTNIYARYFTDEVQQILLPEGTTKFSLKFNNNSIGATSTGDPRLLVSTTNSADTVSGIQSAFTAAGVSVKVSSIRTPTDPNGLRTFNITFVDSYGKLDQPQMEFNKVAVNGSLLSTAQITTLNSTNVKTLKQCSDEFMVNPPEPDNPYTIGADKQNQYNPAVVMDADGDFVITWQSTVADTTSKMDIFARRFTAVGLTDPTDGTFVVDTNLDGIIDSTDTVIHSVRPLGSAFQVNTFTTEQQTEPSIGMDRDGNFVISWTNIGQQSSYFNGITAQRFNRDGDRIGNEFRVNDSDITSTNGGSYVSMSADGHFLITWTGSSDVPHIYAKVYNAQGNVISLDSDGNPGQIDVERGMDSSSVWDSGNNFVITYDAINWNNISADHDFDHDSVTESLINTTDQLQTSGVYGITYRINTDLTTGVETTGNNTIIRPLFRVNDTCTDPLNTGAVGYTTDWPFFQGNSQPAIDVDGDLTVIYDGYGPDTYFDANGIWYSQLDTDPTKQWAVNGTFIDQPVNTNQGDTNTILSLSIDTTAEGGTIIIQLWNQYNVAAATITLPIAYTNATPPQVDLATTRGNIERVLNAATTYVGANNYPNGQYPVAVIDAGADPNNSGLELFTIEFSYRVHGIAMSMNLAPGNQSFTMTKTDTNGNTVPAASPVFGTVQSADPGTIQKYSAIAMQSNGSFVTTWMQYDRDPLTGAVIGTSIWFAPFTESTDTAGPNLTDFILTDGTRLSNGGQIINQSNLSSMVVTFDEDMMTTGTGSVMNTGNWALMKDGVLLNGGINKIYYGMNMASQLGVGSASNKYEAVIFFDGNGASAGVIPLSNGHYQLVAKNSLKDVAGNPMGRTGYSVNGANVMRSFDVASLTGSETVVNSGTTGNQTTSPNQQAVASDGNGRYVAVWTSDASGQEGVWAKVYTETWTGQNNANRQSTVNTLVEIRISDDPYASNAAVAMDADGDFVVTWSSNKNDPGDNFGISWDVYARRYSAAGVAQGDEFMVNTETKDIQRNSSVAMDADGDFMIVWQSFNQDGSGYGVYAQRYSPAGEALDGIDDTQLLSIIGRPEGTFKLKWVDSSGIAYTSQLLTVNNDETITLASEPAKKYSFDIAIQKVMESMGATVQVTLVNPTLIMVQFTGKDGHTSQNLIEVDSSTWTAGDPGKRIEITHQVIGRSGEIQVNDTTIGDQLSPSIAASQQGVFVVTWTGYGQNGDAAYESNIYAKEFQAGTTSQFDIVVQFSGGLTPSQQAIFDLAAARWESIIVGDIPDVLSPLYGYIDDLVIDASGAAIDGSGGILGQAGPDELRNGSFLPDHGIMQFDTADLADMEASGQLLDVITHEMGHVLGFGTIWTDVGVYVNGTGQYTGTAALAAYRSEFVGQQSATSVPVELGGGGGTANGHWNEVDGGSGPTGIVNTQGRDMEYELMTGWLNSPAFISKTTAYQFQDLGYVVDASAAGNLRQLGSSGSSSTSRITGWTESLTGQRTYVNPLPSTVGGGKTTAKLGSSPEILVNSTTANDQKWSSVAADADGDFVVTWTSYGQDGTGNGAGAGSDGLNGVYAQRFNSGGAAVGAEIHVNTFNANDQQHSQVAMDADGDFVITWESFQDRPTLGSGLPDSPNSFGIYAQRYLATSKLTAAQLASVDGGRLGSEFRLNTTTDGDQRYPSIAMDATGDIVAVWSGNGTPDNQGVYYQRFTKAADDAGPIVSDVSIYDSASSSWKAIYDNATLTKSITQVLINFDEDLSAVGGTSGLHSWSNPSNWKLYLEGTEVVGGVSSVQFLLNTTTKKYEALVTFDGNFDTAGTQALAQGNYTLVLSENIQDVNGNALDGNLDGTAGGNYVFNFKIDILGQGGTVDDPVSDPGGTGGTSTQQNPHTFPETPGAVAVDADGQHIVTWTAFDTDTQRDRVYFQIFDADGTPADIPATGVDSAPVTPVTPATMLTDNQRYSTVACDADGDFVITWTEIDAGGNSDVYARRYNSMGQPVGNAFRVNTHTAGNQMWSNVDMDSQGDFVITWSSYGQENNGQVGMGYGVYATKYNSYGQVQIPEFQVNTTTAGDQYHSSVALMDDGWFTVVFEGAGFESTNHDIFVRLFSPTGLPTDVEYDIQYYTGTELNADFRYPDIAATPNGDSIVIVYQRFSQDGNGWEVGANTLQIVRNTQDFLPSLTPTSLEIAVNSTITGDQKYPSVAMDNNGGFVVSWSGFGNQTGQSDASGDGVFYQRFGYAPNSGTVGRIGGERRANVSTSGNQYISSVASDASGNVVIAFTGVGSTANSTAVYKTVTSVSVAPQADHVGATITDVLLPDRTRIWDGYAFTSTSNTAITKLIVVLSEDMYISSTGTNSIINPYNWALYRNGSEITGAISNVTFAYNPQSRKYEATVTFDGDGINGSTIAALAAGEYKLVLKSNVIDKLTAGNSLNSTVFSTSSQSFTENFIISSSTEAQTGGEFRVDGVDESGNSDIQYRQTLNQTEYGSYMNTGNGSTNAIAVDNDGDFVVVWTSFGQDDPTDPNGAGIYMRMYDRNNNPLTNDVKVNTYSTGQQINPSVAMDADGDFIVTWTSQGQDIDGTWGIYAQRFNAKGQKIKRDGTVGADEFQVNTEYVGDQVNPSVAMNDAGNFVIVWATKGQNFGYFNDIHGQIYNAAGQKVGTEFQVNSYDLPGDLGAPTGSNEINPEVAMDNKGNFVVVWEQIENVDGDSWDSYIAARMFDSLGNPRIHAAGNNQQGNDNLDFRIDGSRQPTPAGYQDFISDGGIHVGHQLPCDINGVYTLTQYMKTARNPKVIMDESGNFIVAWESFEDNDWTIFTAQPYAADYPGPQVGDSADSYGIYYRRFAEDGTPATTGDHNANLVDTTVGVVPDPITGAVPVDMFTYGEQINVALAMDANGDLAVVWSGNGATYGTSLASPTQHDTDGIFVRNFYPSTYTPNVEGLPINYGSTVNKTLSGSQTTPSIAMTRKGDYVIVWSGNGIGDSEGIFGRRYTSSVDNVGPTTNEIRLNDANHTLVSENTAVTGPLQQIVAVFDENMMTTGGTTGTNSVLNKNNWSLVDGTGKDLSSSISGVTFGMNSATNKWEAVITFTGTGLGGGYYKLTASDKLKDAAGNLLNTSGLTSTGLPTTPGVTTTFSTTFSFTVNSTTTNSTVPYGSEFIINTTTQGDQVFSQSGDPWANEESTNRTVAMDHSGDFAVVWASYGQARSDQPYDGDIYVRLFNRDNTAMTGEILVNSSFTDGMQRNANIAMDADGDFIVTWESEGQDADGSWGVYAQRFSSIGQKLGTEFRVNTNYTNDQVDPAVATDVNGNFVIVWATKGQNFSYFNDIHGQIYDYNGQKIGGEFRVNSQNIPGTNNTSPTANEVHPSIAMANDGSFVVTWQACWNEEFGFADDFRIYARMFDSLGNPRAVAGGTNVEFRVDVSDANFLSDIANNGAPLQNPKMNGAASIGYGAHYVKNSQISMDASGNFIVVWESSKDNDLGDANTAESYGIYFRRFNADGTSPMASDHQANLTITEATSPNIINEYFAGDQVNGTIAMDADGDYVIAWDGIGAQPNQFYPTDPTLNTDQDNQGVFVRTFHANSPYQAVPEYTSVETRANRTGGGDQKFASIAMTPDGQYIVVWQGAGIGDSQGIFARRYSESTDTAGPMVTDFLAKGSRIDPNNQITQSLGSIQVVFDEDMMQSGTGSVTNVANYRLLKNGVEVTGGITSVTYKLDPATNKYVATVNVDANGLEAGTPEMQDGQYQLVVLNSIRDKAGNPLQSTGLNPNGASMSKTINFVVSNNDVPDQMNNSGNTISMATANDSDGGYVNVWANSTGIYGRIYTPTWSNSASGRVLNGYTASADIAMYTFTAIGQVNPDLSVAMDADGDFVVTWTNGTSSDSDIMAQRFTSTGAKVGSNFTVNTYTSGIQNHAKVAIDVNGDFVVTWQSYGQDGSGWGVYAQRFDPYGNRLGGTNEVQTIQFVGGWTGSVSLSWDNDNNPFTSAAQFTITYNGNASNTAQQIKDQLALLNAVVEVTDMGAGKIAIKFEGAYGYQNVAPLFLTAGSNSSIQLGVMQEGLTGEFRVNDTTLRDQTDPAIAMSESGSFVISWTSQGQGNDGASNTNIYAKNFVGSASLYTGATSTSTNSYTSTSSVLAGAHYDTYMVTTDDPANHVAQAGTGAEGIVQVMMTDGSYGSGTLLSIGGRMFILTAAHVVWNDIANQPQAYQNVAVSFDMPTGRVTIPAAAIYVNPGYNGDPFLNGNDIALIQLSAQAPAGAAAYDIYRDSNEIGQVGTKYGYGLIGTGTTGATTPSGDVDHTGQNVYESLGSILGMSDDLLVYDFDNGLAQNDAFGVLFNMPNLGLGLNEANSAPGDSGGPTIINGKIASVCTGGVSVTGSIDVLPGTNSSFGEFSVDTRVSIYASWIDGITGSGASEFLVNADTANVNNTSSDQKWSSVSLDANGDFVITWTSYGHDQVGTGYGAGVNGANGVYARRFNFDGTPQSNVFGVNSIKEGNQQHSQVKMDADGDFVVTWETDNTGTSAISAQRYTRSELIGNSLYGANGEIGGEMNIYAGSAPAVNVDDTGDFVLVWNKGNNMLVRQYKSTNDVAGPIVTDVNKETATAKLVSTGTNNDILFTSYDRSISGVNISFVSSSSASVNYDTAARKLTISIVVGTTTAKNVVDMVNSSSVKSIFSASLVAADSGSTSNDGSGKVEVTSEIITSRIFNTTSLDVPVTNIIVTFGEDMSIYSGASGVNSVKNLNNWALSQNGKTITGAITNIAYGKNPTTGKFEATVTFSQQLTGGKYTLTLRDNIQDLFGNKLDGDYSGTPGVDCNITFSITSTSTGPVDPTEELPGSITVPGDPTDKTVDIPVNTITVGNQTEPVVASNDSGAFVVVWTSTQGGTSDIVAQRYDKYGRTLGSAFVVNSTIAGEQVNPDVAMDAFGNFVVTWSGFGATDDTGIYARLYDTFGTAQGAEFRINQYKLNTQNEASVAMDGDGDFVVTWNSYGQDSDKDGIFARRYDILGDAKGNEFQVNSTVTNRQDNSDVAMDQNGDFVVVWESNLQDGSAWGIYGQRFDLNGNRQGGEFRLNNTMNDKQILPKVAMDSNGDFAAVWSSFGQDGSGYGVYARRYNSAGTALDANEVRVNQTTLNWQYQPDIGMDSKGNYVVTWSSAGQDNVPNSDYGIYARMFQANGADNGGYGVFRINATVAGNQLSSAVAVDADGDFTVVWVGADSAGTGIYARVVAANLSTYFPVEPISTTGQFLSNSGYVQSFGDQTPDPTPTPTGPATFNLTGPASGSYTPGQSVSVTWNATNVPASGDISLCYDVDTTWNGNEKWIEIGKVTPANGSGSYTWDTTGVAAGTYYIAGYMFNYTTNSPTYSRLSTPITIGSSTPAPTGPATFNLTGPASGLYTPGQSVSVTWNAANVPTSGDISLCYDVDTVFNGNEKWIEIGKVASANGSGSYAWDTTGMAAGTYYIAGYMYNNTTKSPTYSHLSTPITIGSSTPAPTGPATFSLTGPASGSYTPGQSVSVTWNATNVPASGDISLCYDVDTVFNGNEKWIEIGKVASANGSGSYAWDTTGMAAGTYYIAGYMYNNTTKSPTYSHLSTPITIGSSTPAPTGPATFSLTGPASGSYTPGQSVSVTWNAANVPASGDISLCYDVDTVFNGNEKWIEISKVTPANGSGSYAWDTTGMAAGKYYIAGYMYNNTTKSPTYSHLSTPITIGSTAQTQTGPATFNLTGPASGSYNVGQTISVAWNAANAPTSGDISLCYDVDKVFNGNEKWIEIGKVASASGAGSYTWDTTGMSAGTYYIAGYMYNNATKTPVYSHLSTPITIAATTATYGASTASQTADELKPAGLDNSDKLETYLALSADSVFGSDEEFDSSSSALKTTDKSGDFDEYELALASADKSGELAAIDMILQNQEGWRTNNWLS